MKSILRFRHTSIQRMHVLYAMFSTLLVCILFFGIGFYSYSLQRTQLLQQSKLSYQNVNHLYTDKNDNFWKLYFSVASDDSIVEAFSDYANSGFATVDYITRKNICRALNQMYVADNDIVGFILHTSSPNTYDYIYDVSSKSLKLLSSDSPFREYFTEMDSNTRSITGCHTITTSDGTQIPVYGISGSFPGCLTNQGSLLALYKLDSLTSASRANSNIVQSEVIILTSDGKVVFSTLKLDENTVLNPDDFTQQEYVAVNGSTYYADTTVGTRGRYISINLVPKQAIISQANKNTPLFACLCLLSSAISIFFHLYTGHLNTVRARELINGIKRLENHELSYRFPIYNTDDEYDQIATSINSMAVAMQCNIEQVFIHSLREKEAELGELQAKFNPHFLYNTLEVIRTYLQQKGDDDTAGMVVLLARIFRSSISSEHFTTLQNEFLFINSYLDIYRWRYQNSFAVSYDLDNSLLDAGIIRNLLQPVIENYFVHGFSPNKPNNRLSICAQADDSGHIIITVEDNGMGIEPERLVGLQKELQTCNRDVTMNSSYGLLNLNDRIKLFYSGDCGLSITSIPNEKTTIRICILHMSLEEHKTRIRSR